MYWFVRSPIKLDKHCRVNLIRIYVTIIPSHTKGKGLAIILYHKSWKETELRNTWEMYFYFLCRWERTWTATCVEKLFSYNFCKLTKVHKYAGLLSLTRWEGGVVDSNPRPNILIKLICKQTNWLLGTLIFWNCILILSIIH